MVLLDLLVYEETLLNYERFFGEVQMKKNK